ncbi:MAG: methionine--tRNA ligase subunit beta, partial [Candidatus Altiarchaeota archaeon]|nr:methionine--tRNA ligase subunit beta [Candidatus Altiarchaeota archaeon]
WLDKKTKIVHFIGKDNIPFHTIIWPATLLARGEYNLPWQIASNEYLNLEGKKMSTSRRWVLWLADCSREFGPDMIRYYLLTITPQTSDSDFSLTELKDRVNNELIATLGNFVNRVMTFIEKEGGVIPEPSDFDEVDKRLLEYVQKQHLVVGEHIDRLNFINATSSALALAQEGNKYFQTKEPWKNKSGNTLYMCANLLRTIAIVFEPLLPFTSERIWNMLALEGSVHSQRWVDAGKLGVSGGHRIGAVEPLYVKLDDSKIDEFRRKYLSNSKNTGVKKTEVTELVDFEDFSRIDLRVGKIVEAKDHPNADKLVVLKVDLGELGLRQLVAGIKDNYPVAELTGRQIIVVANLKPAKIRGVESQGMLLAATDEGGSAVLLKPSDEVRNGSRIK